MNCGEQGVKLACKKKRKHSDNAASSLIRVKADEDDRAHPDDFTSPVTLL